MWAVAAALVNRVQSTFPFWDAEKVEIY